MKQLGQKQLAVSSRKMAPLVEQTTCYSALFLRPALLAPRLLRAPPRLSKLHLMVPQRFYLLLLRHLGPLCAAGAFGAVGYGQ